MIYLFVNKTVNSFDVSYLYALSPLKSILTINLDIQANQQTS